MCSWYDGNNRFCSNFNVPPLINMNKNKGMQTQYENLFNQSYMNSIFLTTTCINILQMLNNNILQYIDRKTTACSISHYYLIFYLNIFRINQKAIHRMIEKPDSFKHINPDFIKQMFKFYDNVKHPLHIYYVYIEYILYIY